MASSPKQPLLVAYVSALEFGGNTDDLRKDFRLPAGTDLVYHAYVAWRNQNGALEDITALSLKDLASNIIRWHGAVSRPLNCENTKVRLDFCFQGLLGEKYPRLTVRSLRGIEQQQFRVEFGGLAEEVSELQQEDVAGARTGVDEFDFHAALGSLVSFPGLSGLKERFRHYASVVSAACVNGRKSVKQLTSGNPKPPKS